nr:hypothetical protein [Herbaspirillum lusitanum]
MADNIRCIQSFHAPDASAKRCVKTSRKGLPARAGHVGQTGQLRHLRQLWHLRHLRHLRWHLVAETARALAGLVEDLVVDREHLVDAVGDADLGPTHQRLARRATQRRLIQQAHEHAGAGGRDDVELDALVEERRQRARDQG